MKAILEPFFTEIDKIISEIKQVQSVGEVDVYIILFDLYDSIKTYLAIDEPFTLLFINSMKSNLIQDLKNREKEESRLLFTNIIAYFKGLELLLTYKKDTNFAKSLIYELVLLIKDFNYEKHLLYELADENFPNFGFNLEFIERYINTRLLNNDKRRKYLDELENEFVNNPLIKDNITIGEFILNKNNNLANSIKNDSNSSNSQQSEHFEKIEYPKKIMKGEKWDDKNVTEIFRRFKVEHLGYFELSEGISVIDIEIFENVNWQGQKNVFLEIFKILYNKKVIKLNDINHVLPSSLEKSNQFLIKSNRIKKIRDAIIEGKNLKLKGQIMKIIKFCLK